MDKVKPATILLVEDSEADIELVKFCLKKNKIHLELVVIDHGDDALDYMFQRNGYKDAMRPDIILLDINLPGANGIEILKELKTNDDTKMIPVIMLTSSKHDEDIIGSYSNYANCYLQKPIDLNSFQKIIDIFESFWFTIVTLPADGQHN